MFQKPYQAYDRGNLEKRVEAMAELEIIGKFIKFEFSLQNIVFLCESRRDRVGIM
mgnify:FL=1